MKIGFVFNTQRMIVINFDNYSIAQQENILSFTSDFLPEDEKGFKIPLSSPDEAISCISTILTAEEQNSSFVVIKVGKTENNIENNDSKVINLFTYDFKESEEE